MDAVYLDNNATTAVAEEVLEAMLPWFREQYQNASAPYPSGERAADAVRAARSQVARMVSGRPGEIVFTSGGSESIVTAFRSGLAGRDRPSLVISAVEHSAVLRNAEAAGAEVVSIPVDDQGRLDRDALLAAIQAGPALVSLMIANNETGVLTDLEGVAEACEAAGAMLHLDAIQGPGKLPLDLPATGAHLASLSAHKLHGPKGVGALWVRRDSPFTPLILGGPQESERRAGTENVPGMVGFGAAAALALAHVSNGDALAEVSRLRDRLESGILERVPGARVHGAQVPRLGNTTNLFLPGSDARKVLLLLAEFGVEASAGSACNAQKSGPSPVILAMGFDEEEASRSLRFSLSRQTTQAQVDNALGALERVLETLSALG